MKALSLFSGIGGIDLAAEWAGIETVAFCEREPFCQKVLAKHWPNIPIYDDVCTLRKERLEADGIDTRTIGIIHGGYPCQPFSLAGKREGENDDRHLWPQVKRILQEIRPRWFVGENVAGHITMGLDDVLSDLGNIDYTAQSIIIPACGVGAVHRRDRVVILAHTNSKRIHGSEECDIDGNGQEGMRQRIKSQSKLTNILKILTDTNGEHVERSVNKEISREQTLQGFIHPGSIEDWNERSVLFEPKLLRNYHGVSNGVDRIRGLGNAVVPQQIYPILAAIKQINEMIKEKIK